MTGLFGLFTLFNRNVGSHTHKHFRLYADGRGLIVLSANCRAKSNNKKKIFLLSVREDKVVRAFSFDSLPKPQPTHAAQPNRLSSYSPSPTPSRSLFPSHSSGSSNSAQTPRAQAQLSVYKMSFCICCSLFNLAALCPSDGLLSNPPAGRSRL